MTHCQSFAHYSLDRDVAKLKAICDGKSLIEIREPWSAGARRQAVARHGSSNNTNNHNGNGNQPPLQLDLVLFDVTPGFCVRLRGFDETWPAVISGRSIVTRCTCCSTKLGSLRDIEFVLCPECRFISLAGNQVSYKGGGLGLGINIQKIPVSNPPSCSALERAGGRSHASKYRQ